MGAQPPFELKLLGPPDLRDDAGRSVGLPAGKPLALLIYLHLADGPVPRDHLAGLLWPDSTHDRARGSVRHALWFLRKELGEDLFAADDPVAVAEGRVTSDLAALRSHLRAGQVDAAAALWEQGPPELAALAEGVEWGHWAEEFRLELEQALADALEERGLHERDAGRLHRATQLLEQAARIQPHRLRHHRARIEVLLDSRQFDDAARALSLARSHLPDARARDALDALDRRLAILRGGAPASDSGAAGFRLPFTGRTSDFGALARRWREAVHGAPGVGLITGEPGIGKTRLAEEIAVLARADGARVVRLKADDSERPIEWGLLSEVIQRLLNLPGAAGISPASDGILRSLVPSLDLKDPVPGEDRGRATPALPGPRPSAALSDALTDLVTAVAEDSPLLLILDDLQWADPESRSVLARVATRVRGVSTLLLFTCRVQVDRTRVRKSLDLLRESARTTSVELDPWTRSEVAELLQDWIRFSGRGSGQAIIQRIHSTTRGNPLFVLELLKAFDEEGILESDGEGRWVFHTDRLPPDLPLPDSLRALVDRQLDQLSEEAQLVAAHLARIGHPTSPRMLAVRTGLGPSAVTNAIGDLLQRRMVRWEDPETLTFFHDELRAAVARRFQLHVGLTTGGGAQWSFFRTAVAATFALLLMGAVAYVFARPDRSEDLFGGGTLVVQRAGQIESYRLEASGGEDGLIAVRSELDAGRTTAGSRQFAASSLRGADHVRPIRLVSGEVEWLAAGPLGVSPDGAQLLVHRPVDGNRHQLVLQSRDGEGERVIYEGRRRPEQLDVSPLGQQMLFLLPGRPDFLLVTTPAGRGLARWSTPRIVRTHWCGPERILILVREGDAIEARIWHPASDSTVALSLPGLHLGGETACSPDGRAIVLQGAREGRVGLYLYQPGQGHLMPVELGDGPTPERLFWVPDEVPPLPTGIRFADGKHVRLGWGEQHRLEARLVYGNGSTGSDSLQWRTSDPEVAFVAPSGRVTALGAGRGWIVAEWRGWLRDSIRIEVESTGPGDALFHANFQDPTLPGWQQASGSSRWHRIGASEANASLLAPGPESDSESPATPHWLAREEPVDLSDGLTVEVEFRLPVTEAEGQSIALCFVQPGARRPAELLRTGEASLGLVRSESRQSACVRYPAGRWDQWDPRELELYSHRAFPRAPIDVGSVLPRNDWTHLALSLGAEGSVNVYIDREWAGATPVFLDPVAEPWQVVLIGEAWRTELEIRNLTLWSGLRYEPTPSS